MFETRLLPRTKLLAPQEPLRVSMDSEAIELLADSMKQVGQLQPLLVKPAGEGPACTAAVKDVAELERYIKAGNQFQIIDGHRRFLAPHQADIEFLPCTIVA